MLSVSQAAYFCALSPTSRPRDVIKNELSSLESFGRITNNFLAKEKCKNLSDYFSVRNRAVCYTFATASIFTIVVTTRQMVKTV